MYYQRHVLGIMFTQHTRIVYIHYCICFQKYYKYEITEHGLLIVDIVNDYVINMLRNTLYLTKYHNS